MDIIKQVIESTEKKLLKKIHDTQLKIDLNPFKESMEINKSLLQLLQKPVKNFVEYEKELNELRKREIINKRLIKKVLQPEYLENLYRVKGDLERQQRELFSFKMYVNFRDD